MTTLLQKRQMATIRSLTRRKEVAQQYIETHTQRLQEKLAPYHAEIEICDRMLAEYTSANAAPSDEQSHAE